jgi:hypothetical protein
MKRIIYWLKKIGVLRTGMYSAKGDADKVVEMNIKGELYQSDKEIEKEYEQKNNEKVPNKKNEKNTFGKVTFWIFVVIGVFFVLAFWGGGWSLWKIVGLVLWGVFLRWLWVHVTQGFFAIGKIFVFGTIVVVASLIFTTPDESENVESVDKYTKRVEMKSESKYVEEGVDDDHVVKLLHELDESTGLNFSKIQNDEVVWTGGPGLQLQKAKSFTAQNVTRQEVTSIEKFFTDLGANDGGIGFTFQAPQGVQASGFALGDAVYTGMMCIVRTVDNDVIVGCGWGPTNNPNSK